MLIDLENFEPDESEFFTEKEIEEGALKPTRDEVIFLIHLTEEIFEKSQEDMVPISEAIKGFNSFLKSKIISNNKDLVSLIFYNSDETKNPLNFKGIEVVIDLQTPSAKSIRETSKLQEEYNSIKIKSEGESTPLYEALWTCSQIFKDKGSKDSTQRIFLFTSVDNPDSKDTDLQAKALHHAEELSKKNIEIELFPLRINNKIFDYNQFFSGIISFDVDDLNKEMTQPNDKLAYLNIRLRRKEFKKRILGKVDMGLGEGVNVGVKL